MKKLFLALALLLSTSSFALTGINIDDFFNSSAADAHAVCLLGGGTWDAASNTCTGFQPHDPCKSLPWWDENSEPGCKDATGEETFIIIWCDPNGDGVMDATDETYCNANPPPSGCGCSCADLTENGCGE